MIFKSIKFSGIGQFAGQVAISFDDKNNQLYGDNNQGKTTIAAAIVYAITGRTLTGSPLVDDLINSETKLAEVEFICDIAGKEYIVYRSRDNTGKTTKNTCLLNGEKADAVKLVQLFREWQYFLAAFWPPFIHSMEPKEASELLRNLLPPITQDEVKASMDNAAQLEGVSLGDPAGVQKRIRQEIKEISADIERIKGSIDVYAEQLKQLLPDAATAPTEELKQIEQQIAAVEAGKPEITDIMPFYNQIDALRREYAREKQAIKQPPSEPSIDTTCPTCGQQLPLDAYDKIIAQHQELCAQIDRDNAAAISRMNEITTKAQALKDKIDEIEKNNTTVLESWKKANANIDALKQRRNELQRQCDEANRINTQREFIAEQQAKAKANTEKAADDLKDSEATIHTLRLQIDALGEYTATKARLMLEQIAQYLGRAAINLYEVVKSTGELKPTFELTYDGQPFSGMSNSNRIRCGLEISRLINQLTGMNYPVYIDNAESITEFGEIGSQLFTAYVSADCKLSVNGSFVVAAPAQEKKRGRNATQGGGDDGKAKKTDS